MIDWRQHLRHGLHFCSDCLLLLGCWVLWLLLGAALAVQVAVVVSKEFAVPAFVLRSIEGQFIASGVKAHFGRTTFDVSGGVLLENVQLSLPQFAEPIAEARAVFVQLDPWALLTGRIEPRRVHVTGANLFVPAMLAPSGRSEEILRELECTLVPGDGEMEIGYLNARVAGMTVAVHGAFALPPASTTDRIAPLPLLQKLADHYAMISRQLIRAGELLGEFDRPELQVLLFPSPTRGAIARLTFTARALNHPVWHEFKARELRAVTRLPLFGESPVMSPLELAVEEVTAAGASARGVHARVRGVLKPTQFSYRPREIALGAEQVSARGFALEAITARLEPGPLPVLAGEVVARSLGEPLAVSGRADLAEQTAALEIDGALSPRLLEPIGAILGRDLRRFIGFGRPVELRGRASFLPGWKFERLTGRIVARDIDAYHVGLDYAHGDIEFDGRHFVARQAFARLGDNFARGSFEQDLKTRAFRFLLEGRLRPLAIGGWFREWWPDFFEHFKFPVAPPNASVDVAGRWFAGRETTVFVFAESAGPSIRGAEFDYARTLMFIRPNFFDGLELFGIRGVGDLRGTFTRTIDVERNSWKELTLALESTIDLEAGAKLLGPTLGPRLEPYTFEHAPRLKVTGRFTGPAAPDGEHQQLRIAARSNGGFTVFGFPGRNLSFDATLHDEDLVLENVNADIAAGTLTGRAKIWGGEAQRRLGFDASLRAANLGQAATAVSQYLALRRGASAQAAAAPVLTGQNNTKFDLSVSAEGAFYDPLSYYGSGNVAFAGPELGQVRLLGLLSELLNFTALRFTNAHADFKLEGPQVTFRSIGVTGANSAIQAHGHYSLQHDALDFNARVYPFQESKSLLQNMVGVVLLPFSAVLEVRLTGGLREPNWAFVIGPTNLFRSLSEPAAPAPTQTDGIDYLKRRPSTEKETN